MGGSGFELTKYNSRSLIRRLSPLFLTEKSLFLTTGNCTLTDCFRTTIGHLMARLCLESGGNWFWRLSERVEFCGGQAARSRVSSAIS